MEESRATSYDVVGYPSLPIYYTHPNRLATLATLFGMKPAAVEHCRVLEIGCFDGVNLAAMAVGLPRSEFVGVDAAGTAIARGRAMAEDVGLKNLILRHIDLMEMAPDYGEFDYIIVHGVYTWVPQPVSQQIMAICKGSLAPQGVAYISYNALPGCHNRLMIREMMQFHNRDFHDPQQKMQQGLNLLKVLANSLEKDTEPYTQFLKGEFERLSGRALESLYHDELSEVFAPLYFHQFMEQARQHDLQFLAEADFFDMVPRGMTPKAVEILDRIGDDIVLREQYLDFMRGRHFRKTLLCHPNVPLNRNLKPDCVKSYYVSTFAKPESPTPNSEPGAKETFENNAGAKTHLRRPPGAGSILVPRGERPRANSFPTTGDGSRIARPATVRIYSQTGPRRRGGHCRVRLGDLPSGPAGPSRLCTSLYVCVSDKPMASPLARWQARRSDIVSTLHHRTLKLQNAIQRGLLALLDGTRDRTALRADLLQVFASGALDWLDEDGKPISDMSVVGKAIDDELEGFLQKCSTNSSAHALNCCIRSHSLAKE